jgi:asparagine synthase (glutamine-hydrolysing)
MCGIWARLGVSNSLDNPMECLKKLEARGPEGSSLITVCNSLVFGFTRLAINGLTEAGMQPYSKNGITWMCNGEIYNHKELEASLGLENTGSDCYCIGDLYMRHRDNLLAFVRALDGVFALALYDHELKRLVVARDPYGVRPLFIGSSSSCDTCVFSSEIKAIGTQYDQINPFLPGTIEVYDTVLMTRISSIKYHTIPWITNPQFRASEPLGVQDAGLAVRFALEEAVRKRMLTDRPVAALLSGGLDSSLIASLVQRNLEQLGQPPLKTFSIGFKGSSDLKHARIVADWIKSDHTEIEMTADEFFDAIPDVIRAIESYDTTTVRASTGNYLIAKKIREQTNCKVVFNGDGSDEVFGGYLYFNNAPNDEAFHAETERLLEDIHTFDVLRSDRSISANGLEARTPFLDKQFVSVVRSIHPSMLRPCKGGRIEKALLRQAFDDGVTLPQEVLMRRKEAFSDGVSRPEKAWFQEIQDRVLKIVPPDWMNRWSASSHLMPRTPEEYYYRFLFTSIYGLIPIAATVPYRWMPKWSPETNDPSARTLAVYDDSA